MNKIFSTNDPDPLERLRGEANKIPPKQNPHAERTIRQELSSPETAHLDLLSAQHRLALRNEFTLRALEHARSLLEEKSSPAQKEDRLLELIRESRFQNHQVLTEYEGKLGEIFRHDDRAAFDALIAEAGKRLLPSPEDEIVRENVAALSSRNPDDMLKEIIRELKTQGVPPQTVARQRVIDLLR